MNQPKMIYVKCLVGDMRGYLVDTLTILREELVVNQATM